MSRSPVKIGLVGLGRWGKNIALEAVELGVLASCSSRGSEASAAWAGERLPSVPISTNEQMAADPSIEAVVIATPTDTHASLARDFLAAGKHVLVEKPLASTGEAARELASLARSKGLVLMTGYVFLHHPAYRELKRLSSGKEVRAVSLSWRKQGTFAEPIEHALLTHHLAIALDFLGTPLSGTLRAGKSVETACDETFVELGYPNTALFTSHIDRSSGEREHCMRVSYGDGSELVWKDQELRDNAGAVLFSSEEPALRSELRAFTEAVAGNEQPPDLGVAALELSERLVRSA